MLDEVVKKILTEMTLSRDLKDVRKRIPDRRKASAAKALWLEHLTWKEVSKEAGVECEKKRSIGDEIRELLCVYAWEDADHIGPCWPFGIESKMEVSGLGGGVRAAEWHAPTYLLRG